MKLKLTPQAENKSSLSLLSSIINGTGPDDPKKKSKYDPVQEARTLLPQKLKYDNNITGVDLLKSVAQKTGVNPNLLLGSSYVEGLNKSIAHPDDVSDAYNAAKISGDFPVDGFYNYGLDTFGSKLPELIKKGYLPQDFANNVKTYPAKNEKGEQVLTAAFKNNASALTAKAAMLKDSMQTVNDYAQKLGVPLDDKAKNYFTMAAYNGGWGNAKIMLDEYSKAKDKNGFIDNGLTTRQGVHKNLVDRLKLISSADELLNPKK